MRALLRPLVHSAVLLVLATSGLAQRGGSSSDESQREAALEEWDDEDGVLSNDGYSHCFVRRRSTDWPVHFKRWANTSDRPLILVYELWNGFGPPQTGVRVLLPGEVWAFWVFVPVGWFSCANVAIIDPFAMKCVLQKNCGLIF